MATVKIGDVDVDVLESTVYLWKELRSFQKDIAELNDEQAVDRAVKFVHLFVGHNEFATIEWLEQHLPMPVRRLLGTIDEILTACGFKERKPEAGEASPQ